MTIVKKTKTTNIGIMLRIENHCALFLGKQVGKSTAQINMRIQYKARNRPSIAPNYTTYRYIPKGLHLLLQRHLIHIH